MSDKPDQAPAAAARQEAERNYDRRQSEHKSTVIDKLNATIDAQAVQIADLQAALDATEVKHGVSSTGNVWRFFRDQAKEAVASVADLRMDRDILLRDVAILQDRLTAEEQSVSVLTKERDAARITAETYRKAEADMRERCAAACERLADVLERGGERRPSLQSAGGMIACRDAAASLRALPLTTDQTP